MPSNTAEIAVEAPPSSNPLDFIPDEIPFDVPYGLPVSLEQAQAVIQAAVAEAKKRNWKMNVAVADSGGNLVAFQRMDGAMLASIQIAQHKARAAVTFRRPTKVFEDGINLMHLNYLLAFDGIIASRGGARAEAVPRRELLRTAHGSGLTKGECCGHSLLNGAARSAVRCLTLDVCPNG
jgi:glc operon protein GlcG